MYLLFIFLCQSLWRKTQMYILFLSIFSLWNKIFINWPTSSPPWHNWLQLWSMSIVPKQLSIVALTMPVWYFLSLLAPFDLIGDRYLMPFLHRFDMSLDRCALCNNFDPCLVILNCDGQCGGWRVEMDAISNLYFHWSYSTS